MGCINKIIERQPFEMRTTFFEMCLLNDTSQVHDISFIRNGKEWGQRDREWVKSERQSVAGKGLWRGSQTCWSSIYEGSMKG